MKNILEWLGLIGMAATAIVAAAGDWLPLAQARLAALRIVATTEIAGFNWTVGGGVLFLGFALLLYMNAGNTKRGDGDVTTIDYSLPNFIKVRVLE